MIKGCNKRVVVMRDTGNEMIEEAIFIIKPCIEAGFVRDDDIIRHANSILDKSSVGDFSHFPVNSRKRKRDALAFCTGMILGAAFAVLVFLVF